MGLQIKIGGGYKATEKMAKIHLKKLNLGAFLGRFGGIFWGLNSIDGGSLKTQLLLRRATRGWKSESVSKIGECDGENIIIFVTFEHTFRFPTFGRPSQQQLCL